MINNPQHIFLARLLGLVVLITLGGCAVNPVTGKNELSLVSEQYELSVGSQQYLPSQQSQGGLYVVDPELTDYVTEVGNRIAAVSDRSLPYEFVVLNESNPNAWALPGGKIAVNRGLLVTLDNEAELAAVLGHEVVHSAARHGAKMMERGALIQGALLATAIAAEDSQYGNAVVGAAQVGAQLLNLRYGRDAERESDHYGIDYMVRAGYDPGAAVTLQESFVARAEAGQQNWLSGLFASHPPSEERVRANKEKVAALDLRADLELGRERFQQHMAYLHSVAPAYAAFDRARFLMKENNPDSALKALRQATAIEPKEARFYGAMGDVYLNQKSYKQASRAYSDALQRDPGYYEYYLGRGLTYARLGNNSAAKSDLSRSNELLPTATAMAELGHLSLAGGDTAGAKKYYEVAMGAGGELGQQARLAFVKLDLPENPANYLPAQASISNGVLSATISNQSGMPLRNADVEFSAKINGEMLRRVVTISSLQKVAVVSSGWRISDDDTVSNVAVTVIRVRL
jgi:beta-barrel assembly-enhancing protease